MFDTLRRRLAGRGGGEILALLVKNVAHAARSLRPSALAARHRDREFDRRWGTETSGCVSLGGLAVDPARARHGVRYQPSNGDALAQAVAAFGIDPAEWSFVDYGSGKGRVVLSAAAMGFTRAVGVEFSPELCRVAEENGRRFVARAGAARMPEFVEGDAGLFEPPEGPLLAYLYNPFGPPVIDEVAARLGARAERGDPVLVAYRDPRHLERFLSSSRWELVRSEPGLALLRSLALSAASSR
jgi:hypothetical protein